ncbi:hypothetical protein GOBAR_AA11430 [Gossypium barbadense]|uniref:Uncharacterized protein n=1 Tax=Gossypium barbadense TaxID=3634 RepID=A0A2P5Y0U4_GOSBA|nr:hypothetical protein GOBAR_AA11430 [Gossypium barbadense]
MQGEEDRGKLSKGVRCKLVAGGVQEDGGICKRGMLFPEEIGENGFMVGTEGCVGWAVSGGGRSAPPERLTPVVRGGRVVNCECVWKNFRGLVVGA